MLGTIIHGSSYGKAHKVRSLLCFVRCQISVTICFSPFDPTFFIGTTALSCTIPHYRKADEAPRSTKSEISHSLHKHLVAVFVAYRFELKKCLRSFPHPTQFLRKSEQSNFSNASTLRNTISRVISTVDEYLGGLSSC